MSLETGADEKPVSSPSQACNLSLSDVIIVFSADYHNVSLTWAAVRVCTGTRERRPFTHTFPFTPWFRGDRDQGAALRRERVPSPHPSCLSRSRGTHFLTPTSERDSWPHPSIVSGVPSCLCPPEGPQEPLSAFHRSGERQQGPGHQISQSSLCLILYSSLSPRPWQMSPAESLG